MVNIEEQVRRMELNFRLKFPYLINEIYCLSKYHYVIHCLCYDGDYKYLKHIFDRQYAPAAYHVNLVFNKPISYLYKLEIIDFDNIVDNFNGIVLTEQSLNVLVRGLLWNLDIISIDVLGSGIDTSIKVTVSALTSDVEIKRAKECLSKERLGCDNVSIEKSIAGEISNNYDHVCSGLLVTEKFPFTLKENALWYELVPQIYMGKIKRVDIDFFPLAETACYINCYMGWEQINLRALMVIFHVVYMTPPSRENFDNFLQQQKIKLEELVELIDMGKIVLILTYNENTFSKKFIDFVYEKSPLSIIGQRGINLLLVTYLNELKIKYELIFPNIREETIELFRRADACKNNALRYIAKYMSWPIFGTLESFAYLNLSGPFNIVGFDILNYFKDNNYDDYKCNRKILADGNFPIFSINSYVAAALDAIFIPTSDDRFREIEFKTENLTSSLLKNYSYKPSTNIKLHQHQLENSHLHLDIFDFKSNISAIYVAEKALEYSSHHVFARLIDSFETMNLEERSLKCREYNDFLCQITKESSKQQSLAKKILLGIPEVLSLPIEVTFGLSLLGGISHLYKGTKGYQNAKEIKIIEKVLKDSNIKINEDLVEDIYVLDKMANIVHLR